jgi:hypothetical protein
MKTTSSLVLFSALSILGACEGLPEDGLAPEADQAQLVSPAAAPPRVPPPIKASTETTQKVKVTQWRFSNQSTNGFTCTGVDAQGNTRFQANYGSVGDKGFRVVVSDASGGRGEYRFDNQGGRVLQINALQTGYLQAMSSDLKTAPQGCIGSQITAGISCAIAAASAGANLAADIICAGALVDYFEDCWGF